MPRVKIAATEREISRDNRGYLGSVFVSREAAWRAWRYRAHAPATGYRLWSLGCPGFHIWVPLTRQGERAPIEFQPFAAAEVVGPPRKPRLDCLLVEFLSRARLSMSQLSMLRLSSPRQARCATGDYPLEWSGQRSKGQAPHVEDAYENTVCSFVHGAIVKDFGKQI